MAVTQATLDALLARRGRLTGNVGDEGLRGLFAALRQAQAGMRFNDLRVTLIEDATSTAQTARAASGKLFGLWVVNASGAAVTVRASEANTAARVVGAVMVESAESAEAYFFADTTGVGADFATSLEVFAYLASDGTTTASAGVDVYTITD